MTARLVIIKLSRSSFHSSGVKFDLSVIDITPCWTRLRINRRLAHRRLMALRKLDGQHVGDYEDDVGFLLLLRGRR